jgi:hypothetical protein
MKNLIMGALALAFTGSASAQEQWEDKPICATVCAEDIVAGSYRFITLTNETNYYYNCTISASNGAFYTVRPLYPRSVSRLFRINDPTAAWKWSCDPIQLKQKSPV